MSKFKDLKCKYHMDITTDIVPRTIRKTPAITIEIPVVGKLFANYPDLGKIFEMPAGEIQSFHHEKYVWCEAFAGDGQGMHWLRFPATPDMFEHAGPQGVLKIFGITGRNSTKMTDREKRLLADNMAYSEAFAKGESWKASTKYNNSIISEAAAARAAYPDGMKLKDLLAALAERKAKAVHLCQAFV